jgi:RNA polymerase sigma factor (sigma-70 family)
MSIDSPNFNQKEMYVAPPFPADLFNNIYITYQTPVSQHILKMLRGVPGFDFRYQDFTQDTFVRAYRALPGLEEKLTTEGGVLRVRPWLFTIGANLCLDELRRSRVRPMDSLEALIETSHFNPVAEDNASKEVILQEEKYLVRSALEELPPRLRMALDLFIFQELPSEEIGRRMGGVSRKAINSLMLRARASFRDAYLKVDGSPEI